MSDFIPKAGKVPEVGKIKIGGLGRAAQKAQAMREKAAEAQNGEKPTAKVSTAASFKAKDSFANTKKTTFQRKAV